MGNPDEEDADDLGDRDGDVGPKTLKAPSITGNAIEGASLTASLGEYSEGAVLDGIWQRCTNGRCQTAAKANDGGDYVLASADVGQQMRLKVTATDAEGVTIAVSPSTEVVVSAGAALNTKAPELGEAFVFRVVNVTAGTWVSEQELTTRYTWQRCVMGVCENIEGATGSAYTPGLLDLGSRLKIIETVTNDEGSVSTSSAESNEVTCAEPLASGPLSASSASNVASGVSWAFTGGRFPANAAAIGPGKRSALLVSHSFGYALSTGVEVKGVELRITRRASSEGALRDKRVALYAPAARVKTPSSELWSAGSVTSIYGGPTDTWGQPITSAVINSAQLRIALAVENTGAKVVDASIENVEVVVYYTAFGSAVFNASTVEATGAGNAWANAAAATNENGTSATFTFPSNTPLAAKTLSFGGFAVTLPDAQTVTGVAAEVRQAATPGTLVQSNVLLGSDKRTNTMLPAALGYVSYGGPRVLWGLTSEQLSAPAFKVDVQVLGQALAQAGSTQLDAVRLRVYFEPAEAEEKRAATVLENSANDVAWSSASVGNALIQDDAVASTTLLSDERTSGSLVLSGFAAGLPDNAAISGITLRIKRSATTAGQLADEAVFLRVGAASVGANRANSERWAADMATLGYGGPTDRWNAPLSAADVNDGSLGAELTVAHVNSTGAAAPQVDAVTMTVHYCTE